MAATLSIKFIETKPHIHYQTRAAVALAAIGDVRAVPTLAKRLRMDPLKIYSDQTDWEMGLKRDDNERVIAARMIADLSILHPDKRTQIAEQAEDAVIFWIHEHAFAARQRPARPRGHGVHEGHRRAPQVGEPDAQLPEGRPAAADAGRVGDRAERDALRRLDQGRAFLGRAREGARRAPEGARRHDGRPDAWAAWPSSACRCARSAWARPQGMSEWRDHKSVQASS